MAKLEPVPETDAVARHEMFQSNDAEKFPELRGTNEGPQNPAWVRSVTDRAPPCRYGEGGLDTHALEAVSTSPVLGRAVGETRIVLFAVEQLPLRRPEWEAIATAPQYGGCSMIAAAPAPDGVGSSRTTSASEASTAHLVRSA